MNTVRDISVPDELVRKYIKALIGQFYKILPIKESGEPSLGKYMESLQRELMGFGDLIQAINYDELYMSLLAVLQHLIERESILTQDLSQELTQDERKEINDTSVGIVRCDVFKAISICKKLINKYCPEEPA